MVPAVQNAGQQPKSEPGENPTRGYGEQDRGVTLRPIDAEHSSGDPEADEEISGQPQPSPCQ